MEKMLFESSFYGRDYGQNLCFFSKKKKKKCLPTYSNFEFEKMGTKKFFYHGLTVPHFKHAKFQIATIRGYKVISPNRFTENMD